MEEEESEFIQRVLERNLAKETQFVGNAEFSGLQEKLLQY